MLNIDSKFVIGVSLLLNLMIQGGATFTSSVNHHVRCQRHSFVLPPSRSSLLDLRGGDLLDWRGGESTLPLTEDVLNPEKTPRLQDMVFTQNLKKYLLETQESYLRGWKAVKDSIYIGDVVTLACFSILPVPLARIYHKIFYRVVPIFVPSKEKKDFETSKIGRVGRFVSQGGRIGLLVYFVEMASRFILNAAARAPRVAKQAVKPTVPKRLEPLVKFPNLFANAAYGYWIATEISRAKRRILRKFYRRLEEPETYDGIIDFLIYITASIIVLDASHFDLRGLVRSLVAVGGLSSLVVGLALKEPVSQLLQGALMMASNKFHRNETIRLGDGTQGKVVDIGLLETTIMGGDDITVKIPHGKMTGQKFSNISRMQRSQAKFDLRFSLEDMGQIEEIQDVIRQEIQNNCPKLVTDGSRPFQVRWTELEKDAIVVSIDTHHYVTPSSNAYWDAREAVLVAISKAMDRMKVALKHPLKVNSL